MYTAIVFLPLLGFLIAGIFGRLIGPRPSEVVTTSLLFVSAVLSWIAFFEVGFSPTPVIVAVLGNWFTSGALTVDWALRIDTLTVVMLVVVTTVSSLVHLYSIGYMAEDPEPAALLRLSVAVHFRHADAGDGRQSRAAVLRLGRRRPHVLSADRLLVRKAVGQCGGDQGLRRQPRRRFRLCARHFPGLCADRFGRLRHDLRRRARASPTRRSMSSASMSMR